MSSGAGQEERRRDGESGGAAGHPSRLPAAPRASGASVEG